MPGAPATRPTIFSPRRLRRRRSDAAAPCSSPAATATPSSSRRKKPRSLYPVKAEMARIGPKEVREPLRRRAQAGAGFHRAARRSLGPTAGRAWHGADTDLAQGRRARPQMATQSARRPARGDGSAMTGRVAPGWETLTQAVPEPRSRRCAGARPSASGPAMGERAAPRRKIRLLMRLTEAD